ncbi:MAG: succinylglutamate desuccinylase/aspartoacylase family protein [Gemmatimonadota bacterium]|nr:succinylglutamate desuccinylase/aspartoacylase family protein [Gemmatimonadota bacterium]
MSDSTPAPYPDRGDIAGKRVLGSVRGDLPGPMLVCVAGLHGNEPSGNHAMLRVLTKLVDDEIPLRGDLVALGGNITALGQSVRFIDEDMNRVWQPDRVLTVLSSLRVGRDASRMVGSAELAEQRELVGALRQAAKDARGPVRVLDLHTTSAESAPFTTLGDTLQNRTLARALPIPAVLGLEEQIDGAMLQYFDLLGWAGIGIEGGSHGSPGSIDAHEDAVWVLLETLGMVMADDVPDLGERRARLAGAATSLPPVVDVRYRHAIAPEDGFRMDPGFPNFVPVTRGQRLGEDVRGPVAAPLGGLLFLPLYQKQGDDGFFIVRAVRPVWLSISRWLRERGWDRRATWIPGVIRHPERDDAVILARWATNRWVLGLLHLLGFNARREGERTVMIRRVESAALGSDLDLRR